MSKYTGTIVLTVIIILAFSGLAHSDDWDGGDKQLHFIAGGLVGLAGYAAHDILAPEARERDKFLAGWLMGTSVGLAKEMFDEARYGGFSYKDLVVTSAGAAVGSMLGVGIVWVDDTIFLSKAWSW